MPPRKTHGLPDNMTYDIQRGRWIVRNPVSKKRKKFSDKAEAEKAAEKLNQWLECERALKALTEGRPTIAGLCVKWKEDRMALMPWSDGTRANYLAKVNRIERELGKRTIMHTDCMYIEDWIAGRTRTADAFNDWRYVFVLLWKFAVSRKLIDVNEPAKIEERSTSKKLEANQKQRLPLDIGGFKLIYEKADPWLQLAMKQSLITLQARLEICNMQHSHYRDGHLYVIRHKVAGDSDMAFIKIKLTDELLDLKAQSLALDNTLSPYLIHRRPDSMRREHIETKPHWTYVTPDYLSGAFAEARDQIAKYAEMKPRQRPTFHEVRGLGSRLYEDAGMSKTAIQALMTHAHAKTTEIYLEGGAQALKDSDYQEVVAPLKLRDVL